MSQHRKDFSVRSGHLITLNKCHKGHKGLNCQKCIQCRKCPKFDQAYQRFCDGISKKERHEMKSNEAQYKLWHIYSIIATNMRLKRKHCWLMTFTWKISSFTSVYI